MAKVLIGGLLFFVGSGCIGGGDPQPFENLEEGPVPLEVPMMTGTLRDALDPNAYPAGPYGTEPGDVIEDLAFPAPGGTLTLDGLRLHPGARLALLWIEGGGFSWSGVVPEGLRQFDADYSAEGLRIAGVLVRDANGDPADLADAEAFMGPAGWDVPFPYAIDPFFETGRYFDLATAPAMIFIDTSTMRIRAIESGWGEEAYRDIIEEALRPAE